MVEAGEVDELVRVGNSVGPHSPSLRDELLLHRINALNSVLRVANEHLGCEEVRSPPIEGLGRHHETEDLREAEEHLDEALHHCLDVQPAKEGGHGLELGGSEAGLANAGREGAERAGAREALQCG